jgi:hypothetical protein
MSRSQTVLARKRLLAGITRGNTAKLGARSWKETQLTNTIWQVQVLTVDCAGRTRVGEMNKLPASAEPTKGSRDSNPMRP